LGNHVNQINQLNQWFRQVTAGIASQQLSESGFAGLKDWQDFLS
jgi:hypothetical protein